MAKVWHLALALMAISLSACNDGTAPAPVPARIDISAGNAQSGPVGSVLGVQPSVVVLSSKGKPIPRVEVTFAVTSGGGSVAVTKQLTNALGVASAGEWTLGTSSGPQTLTATAAGAEGVAAVITAQAQPLEAVKLVLRQLPTSIAASGVTLSTVPVVQIADVHGNAVPRAGVVVTANAGTALLRNGQATTDASGAATFSGFALSGKPGAYALRFSSASFGALNATVITLNIGPPTQLALVTSPPANGVSGAILGTPPVIEIQDDAGNRIMNAFNAVGASLVSGGGALAGTVQVPAVDGRAVFSNLRLIGGGAFRIVFSAFGLQSVTTNEIVLDPTASCAGASLLTLNFTLGQSARYRPDQAVAPQCLQFDLARNLGQQYLVMVENLPTLGAANGKFGGLFPGPSTGADVQVNITATGAASGPVTSQRRFSGRSGQPNAQSWNFGGGEAFEYTPRAPAGGVSAPRIVRGRDQISVNSVNAAPSVGDTLMVYLAGVPRLEIMDGDQRAVIRYISDDLIIAEDTRLGSMRRGSGGYNKPLAPADLDSIAKAYALHSKWQSDLLFEGRFNRAIEAETPHRVVAVHTLMFADNVWGYTFMSGNYFAWDYWVLTDGATKGPYQHPLRNAHNLFMHEVAHMRHWGLLERQNRQDLLGNTWLVEGFARFIERLPIASYLLNNVNPSRLTNLTLGGYPEFPATRYRDDVPTYLNVHFPMVDGYASSSYVFDYFADQVALTGNDWRAALRQFLSNGGQESDLNRAVGSLLPGLSFESLFTRARIALYTDDIGTFGLPDWTQYHQYNLRASREPGTSAAFDPRVAWPIIQPGTGFGDELALPPGAAFGYLIDGVNAKGNGRIIFEFAAAENAVLSITRIR